MKYISTRGSKEGLSSGEAILKGICEDGGLFVPEDMPSLSMELQDLTSLDYRELALLILKKFLTDFSEQELKDCVAKAYDCKFDTSSIAPLVRKNEVNFLELYHGPTLAFKDIALTLLPHLLKASAAKYRVKEDIVILTATSGDTGKAALEGFGGVDGTHVIVFFPEDGVSPIQKLQMVTQGGCNTCVYGVNGNFDDAQTGVKNIFNNNEYNSFLKGKGYILSSANSINIGRLVPQIVYYFHSYASLLSKGRITSGEEINFAVPTGNFGNILAGYYAKQMGLPIGRLICASNENNVLYDFLKTGVYDKRRELILTSSPSMDILISSNLERLLWEISGRDCETVRGLMADLKDKGCYKITEAMKDKLSPFYGGYATEKESSRSIKSMCDASGYIMDPHTAVAYTVYTKYRRETGDTREAVILSTASPFKFGKSVCSSLGLSTENLDDFQALKLLQNFSGLVMPKAVSELNVKPILHSKVVEKSNMQQAVSDFLKVR
jgi:threonine synthase